MGEDGDIAEHQAQMEWFEPSKTKDDTAKPTFTNNEIEIHD